MQHTNTRTNYQHSMLHLKQQPSLELGLVNDLIYHADAQSAEQKTLKRTFQRIKQRTALFPAHK